MSKLRVNITWKHRNNFNSSVTPITIINDVNNSKKNEEINLKIQEILNEKLENENETDSGSNILRPLSYHSLMPDSIPLTTATATATPSNDNLTLNNNDTHNKYKLRVRKPINYNIGSPPRKRHRKFSPVSIN